MGNAVSSVLNNVADRLAPPTGGVGQAPADKSAATANSPSAANSATAPSASSGVGNIGANLDRIVGERLNVINAHVAAAEKQAADPVGRRDCIRKGLMFHVFVVVALLALLWVAYIALKLLGNDDDDDYYYRYAEPYYYRRWNNYPWSLT